MLIANITAFNGANLQIDARRLAAGLGVEAINLRRGGGDLQPILAAATVLTTSPAPMTDFISAWRFGRQTPSDNTGWVRWTVKVDVVRSLIGTDLNEEIHYTGDGVPKTTDTLLAFPTTGAPAASRTLGVPKPTTVIGTPTVLSAGSAPPETRVYVDTYLTDGGRESAPGVPVTVTVNGGSTMTFPSFPAVPSGSHGITKRRIYVSTDGGDYQLCLEQLTSVTTGTDNLTRGAILQSGGDPSKPAWEEPLDDMAGLIELWNGMLGGHLGKAYMVCEPYKAWAWPVEYQEVIPHDIIGSGRWLQNWVILTTAHPYIVTGSGPLNMGHQPVAFNQACVSARSIVSIGHGVVWASPNGLCYIGQAGPQVLTDGIFTPEQWQALDPTTMHANRWERYVLVFFDPAGDGPKYGMMIDPLAPQQGVIYLTEDALGTFYDPIGDRLYLLDTLGVIKRWNTGDPLTATYKSPILRHQVQTNAGYALVVADEPTSVVFTLWANALQAGGTRQWTQIYTATVTTNEAFALPSGYEAQEYQIQLETETPVQAVMLAEDVDDLP